MGYTYAIQCIRLHNNGPHQSFLEGASAPCATRAYYSPFSLTEDTAKAHAKLQHSQA